MRPFDRTRRTVAAIVAGVDYFGGCTYHGALTP
jgi:hypothetical protein